MNMRSHRRRRGWLLRHVVHRLHRLLHRRADAPGLSCASSASTSIVEERQCLVYVLFGKVRLILDEPGLHFPIATALSWRALFVNFFGDVRVVDLRLDQEYLRSQPVNSEEGAPMGIGIWYEMWISDPVSYLFKNADPRGSLRANVSNATVRNLSNMKLSNMLETAIP